MAFDSIFPFLPSNANSPPQLFPYDIVINTAFPGIEFIGTEPNAEYQEIREVNGSLWLVTNAMYNENLLQWDQESNQNTTLPAFALELNGNGDMTRYESPATLVPSTPITWTPLWTVTTDGLMDSTPLEVTGTSAPMNQLQVTWDPGVGIAPTAREVDITDIDSSPNSLLDNLVVNGVQVWTVNKEGVLIHGTVPASAIPGIFNNPTFTGTSTFNGPVVMTDGLTVTGGETVDTLDVTGTSTFTGTATFGTVDAADVNVSGITTTGNLVVTGTAENGSGGPIVPITSPNGTISVVTVGNGYQIEVPADSVGSTVQDYVRGLGPATTVSVSFTLPLGVGTQWTTTLVATVSMSSPLVTGTLTLTGSGATGVDQSWNTNPSNAITNPSQGVITMVYGGDSSGGSTLLATFTVTGNTIANINAIFTASRFT